MLHDPHQVYPQPLLIYNPYRWAMYQYMPNFLLRTINESLGGIWHMLLVSYDVRYCPHKNNSQTKYREMEITLTPYEIHTGFCLWFNTSLFYHTITVRDTGSYIPITWTSPEKSPRRSIAIYGHLCLNALTWVLFWCYFLTFKAIRQMNTKIGFTKSYYQTWLPVL